MRVTIWGAVGALLLSGAAVPALAASDTGTATVTILRPLTVTKNADLKFGTIVEPSSGSSTVTVDTTGTRTTALDVASGTVSVSNFTVAGEDAQAVTVSVPASFSIANTSGPGSLTVTTTGNTSNVGSGTLAGGTGLGSAGSLTVKVGGQITVTNTTNSGLYSGTFSVSASYN